MSERRNLAIAYFREHYPDSLTLRRLEDPPSCWENILEAVIQDGLQGPWVNLIKGEGEACVQSLKDDAFRRSLDPNDRFELMRCVNAGTLDESMVVYYGRIDAPNELPKRERRRLTTIVCKSNRLLRFRLRRHSKYDNNNFDWVERIIIWWYCLEW